MFKKVLCVFIVVVMMAFSITAMADNTSVVNVSVPQAPNGITIDGTLDPAFGTTSFPVATYKDPTTMNGATGTAYLAWNGNTLYYYIAVNDTTPNHENDNSYERDCVEFFIDPQSGKGMDNTNNDLPYAQIRIASAPDAEGDPQVDGGVQNMDSLANGAADLVKNFIVVPLVPGDTGLTQGYVIEAEIDLTGFANFTQGMTVPFEFQVGDNQNGDTDAGSGRTSQAFMAMSDNIDNQWQWAGSVMGLMTLDAAIPAATTAAPDTTADNGGAVVAPDTTAPVTSPTTGDNDMMIAIALSVLALGVAFVVIRRKATDR